MPPGPAIRAGLKHAEYEAGNLEKVRMLDEVLRALRKDAELML